MNKERVKEMAKMVGVSVAVSVAAEVTAVIIKRGVKVAKNKYIAYKEKKLEDLICED